MDAPQLPGMPNPWPLRVTRAGDGRVVAVHAGPMLLTAFSAGDLEMRDLAICALTEGSRFQGKTIAAAFGIQPSQVSRIRSRYRQHGARGLVHQMGRPPILSPARLRQARLRAGQGLTHAEIGCRLGEVLSRTPCGCSPGRCGRSPCDQPTRKDPAPRSYATSGEVRAGRTRHRSSRPGTTTAS